MGKLIRLGIAAGAVAFVVRLIASQKREWQGLTETELRERLQTRIPDRVPEEKRAEIIDTVVAKLRGTTDDSARVVSLIEARYEAVNAHDWDRFESFYGDSIVWDDPGLAEPIEGPKAVRARLETLNRAYPDLRWNLDRIFSRGDLVCAEFTFTGTQKGELPTRASDVPVEPTDRSVRLSGVGVYRVQEGRIVDSKVYFDFGRLLDE